MSGIIVHCRRMVGRLRMSMLATLFGSNLSRDQPKSQHSTACNFVFLDLNIRQSRLLFRSEKRGRNSWKRISWLVICFCCVRKICYLTADEISSSEFFKNSSRKKSIPWGQKWSFWSVYIDRWQRNFQKFRSEKRPISPIEWGTKFQVFFSCS